MKYYKNNIKRQSKNMDWRVFFLKIIIFILTSITIGRLFILQVIQRETYAVLASGQHEIYKKLIPTRGNIIVREKDLDGNIKNFPLATNKEYALVYAQPKLIDNPFEVAKLVYPILFGDKIEKKKEEDLSNIDDINENELYLDNDNIYQKDDEFINLLNKLNKHDDPYEPLRSKVDMGVVAKLEELEIKGIDYLKEFWRYYPDENIESHVLGFVRKNDEGGVGQYGLEGSFNDVLSGSHGYLQTEKSARGVWIALKDVDLVEARNGSDLYLTLDRTIQFKIHEELLRAVEDYEIEEGTIIVMQPKTGAILAMANYPNFDPNIYNYVENIDVFNNPATFYSYEPGSIFKPITMGAALDEDKVSPSTKYFDEGFVKVDRYTIRNSDGKANHWQTMTDVLDKSLNTGVIFAAKQIGDESFLEYVKKFGFGAETGVEFGNESIGNIKSLENLNDVYTFTASFGQGITVTPIQMAVAYSAIANDGKLMRPYIVDEVIDFDGNSQKTKPVEIRQVISPRASTLLKAMLVSVVNSGHAKGAGVKGYNIGGKTGTAQVSDPGGGYSEDRFNHSFVGFGPNEDPQFVIMVKLNNPQGVRFSSESAAPIFGRIAEFILKYYEISPTTE